jgi:hypothetical protein
MTLNWLQLGKHKKAEGKLERLVKLSCPHFVLVSYLLHDLKAGAGAPKVGNIKKVAARLALLQEIDLPADLFTDIPLPFLQKYQRQVSVESISHLQRRDKLPPDGNESRKTQLYTTLAVFCWVRQRKIMDYLADLFIRTLRTIRLRAKSRVEKRIIADYIRVGGKQQLLFRLAQAMQAHPDGAIKDVLYPIVGTERLDALVEEARQQGPYHQSVQTKISGSYTQIFWRIFAGCWELVPSTKKLPSDASKIVVKMRMAVVLPAPFGPKKPIMRPACKEKERPRRAGTPS